MARHREHRSAAVTAGILYITGTVAGLLSATVTASVSGASDPLVSAADHPGAIATGALLILAMGLSLAFIPVVLFPVLRTVSETLAVGYVVVRGAIETACYVVMAVGLLLLVPVSEAITAAGEPPSTAPDRMRAMLLDADAANAVLALVFCLGAGIFYFMLFRSGIVPRWISLWGLVAIPFYVAAALLTMYNAIESMSTAQVMLFAPMGVQEMVLAVWMIARGFRPSVATSSV